MSKKIYLVDGNSFIYRMFFALPEFSTKDGKIVNAIFGMAKFFVGQLVKENPNYLIFIKDAKGENFRHKLYDEYKATRDRMPDNLRDQIANIENMINKMGIDIVEIDGYEADDVIGTLAEKFNGNKNYEVDILTGDKDLYQLTSDNIKIYDTMKKKKFGPNETVEKFGVENKHVVDYLAIVGDKSDNIPGIDGFGPAKAVALINTIGTVEDIYAEVEKVESGEKSFSDFDKVVQSCFKGKTFEKLVSSKENAFLSKRLATLDKTVNLEGFNLENFTFTPEELTNNEVKELFKNFEFNSLLGEEKEELNTWKDLGLKVNIIGDKDGLNDLFKKISNPPQSSFKAKGGDNKVVLDTETTSLNIMEAELVGVSIYLDDKNIYYINRLHNGPQVHDKDLKKFLKDLFELDILIIGHNIKYDLEIIELFLGKEDKNHESEHHLSQMSLGL